MELRTLALVVPVGVALLLLAPTLTSPPDVTPASAADQPGPVRLTGTVDTLLEGDGRTTLLVRNGSTIWVVVRGATEVAPGDRVRVTARPEGGLLVADRDDVEILTRNGTRLLRHVARDPRASTGQLRLQATVDRVHRTVAYLKDGGHRLRVVPGEAAWPPDVDRGRRIVATGRLRYDATTLRYVLALDGIRHA